MTVLSEGKTKRIIAGPRKGTVLLQAKDTLTGGDAAVRAEINQIGAAKTRQAAKTMGLLARCGIPTAFIEQQGDIALLCDQCEMLPLEFVVRRYAWGSFLKRRPDFSQTQPYRFDQPLWEIFHKDSVVIPPHVPAPEQMTENQAREKFLTQEGWLEGVYTDPYSVCEADGWHLYSAKAPIKGTPLMTIAPVLKADELRQIIDQIVLPAFLALEEAWGQIETTYGPVHLVDIKFEMGRRARDQALVMADVVDNDSWRIWPGGDPKRQLDKQCFRDGESLASVEQNYEIVTRLTEKF
ncbi:MAG: phosphoribosylaminoimidazolesuccinocarboxamide synthase [Pseudomonadota bacterium]